MSEQDNVKNKESFQKEDVDVFGLLKKMQRQLDSMEEKIDSLTRQSKPRSFSDKRPSASYKEYDKMKYPRERKHEGRKEEASSEGKFYHGRPFGKKKDGGKNSFVKNKKSYKNK